MPKRLIEVYRAITLALGVAALVACSSAGAQGPGPNPLSQTPDQIFVQLREAARVNDAPRAALLAALIPDYPVPSYLEYYQLKPQMFDASGHPNPDAPDDAILAFLQKYDGQAIADRLRNDYLVVLGARHDWRNFEAQYARFVLNDDTQVKCYDLEARAANRQQVGDAARALLTNPKWYGDGCVDLVTMLAADGQMTTDDVWQQVRQAYEANYVDTGNRLADALGTQRPKDDALRMAASMPPLLLARGIDVNTPAHELALLAITRIARNDPAQAATAFASVAPKLTAQEQAIGWGTIGFQASLKQVPGALDWYRQSASAPLSNGAFEWRVRAALRAGDWPMVRWAVEAMPANLRNQPVWTYWHARALEQSGDPASMSQATRELNGIAPQFNFYGQLATEELGQKITVPPRVQVSDAEVAAMASVPGFALSQRFYGLNLRLEGNREWNWPLRNMNDRQLLAAAEYARRISLFDRTVNTADRTQTQHDFSLRYLAPYRDILQRDAKSSGLDIEWAYGLIRQESRFIINAQSGVGATGLMQLMPATAQMVARKIGLGSLSRAQMNDIDTNILLGTNYLASIYEQFDDSPVLASAGYNAGPGRPRQWRSTLTRPVEGAIFAETIPFDETREYVKNVLSNTVYYAALFEGQPQSLKARLGIISP